MILNHLFQLIEISIKCSQLFICMLINFDRHLADITPLIFVGFVSQFAIAIDIRISEIRMQILQQATLIKSQNNGNARCCIGFNNDINPCNQRTQKLLAIDMAAVAVRACVCGCGCALKCMPCRAVACI